MTVSELTSCKPLPPKYTFLSVPQSHSDSMSSISGGRLLSNLGPIYTVHLYLYCGKCI